MDVANAEGDPTKDPQDATEPQDPVTVAAQDPNDADPSAAVVMDHEVPEFNTDRAAWVIAEQQYGILRLCGIRKAMMPIKKPQEMRHLKLLIVAGLVPAGDDLDDDIAADRPRRQPRDVRQGGKGKGRGGGGRHGPDMGDPKAANPGPHRGAWWRNVSDNTEVLVREGFNLQTPELWRLPPGQYVQQAGPIETIVSGQAEGLMRMQILPRGWVTVDASAVGGPRYLEKVDKPSWKVVFTSGSNKGDIVVRETVSLESDEVAVLWCGDIVEQSGPREVLEDGIVRMPIGFRNAGPAGSGIGWVTIDATAQGGPKFFNAVEPSGPPARATTNRAAAPRSGGAPQAHADGSNVPAASLASRLLGTRSSPGAEEPSRAPAPAAEPKRESVAEEAKRESGGSTWDRNRMWRVINLAAGANLPVVTRAGPYGPGSNRMPPEDTVTKALQNGDLVEQVGHSKKVRGYKVMPVRKPGGGEQDGEKWEGWVVQRLVDKTRDRSDAWFEEVPV